MGEITDAVIFLTVFFVNKLIIIYYYLKISFVFVIFGEKDI